MIDLLRWVLSFFNIVFNQIGYVMLRRCLIFLHNVRIPAEIWRFKSSGDVMVMFTLKSYESATIWETLGGTIAKHQAGVGGFAFNVVGGEAWHRMAEELATLWTEDAPALWAHLAFWLMSQHVPALHGWGFPF